ncbi:hypothetical protein [Rhodococcus sp. JS3073]|nr:hypothetical protein [Rhodococcus sp. JS3073]WAM19998.1 hypothetical protein OYT95_40910 [Rhodococcus sp. JS3073]
MLRRTVQQGGSLHSDVAGWTQRRAAYGRQGGVDAVAALIGRFPLNC